jgi:precorrin-6A synthase
MTAMRTILVIGMGVGDPAFMTAQGVEALNRVDVLFVLENAGQYDDRISLRQRVLDRFVGGEQPRVVMAPVPPHKVGETEAAQRALRADWRRRSIELCAHLARDELADGQVGAFLTAGDPALYDGMIEALAQVAEEVEIDVEVVPGVSAVSALAAAHKISLTRPGGAVLITTGPRLTAGVPDGIDDVVVMLDPDQLAFKSVPGEDFEIYWGANLGTPGEILISGPLREVEARIERERAAMRENQGWVYDTYLLRRVLR